MNNKNGLSTIVVNVILVALFLVATVIVWAILINLFNDNPSFTIYKEECRNETWENPIKKEQTLTDIVYLKEGDVKSSYYIYDSFEIKDWKRGRKDFLGVNIEKILIQASCIQNDGKTILNCEKEISLQESNLSFELLEEYDWVLKSRSINPLKVIIKTKTTYDYYEEQSKQICSPVEVDRVELECFNHVGTKINCEAIPDGYLSHTQEIKDGTKIETYLVSDEKGDFIDYFIFSISKQDLTIEWLDENCDCLEYCEYNKCDDYQGNQYFRGMNKKSFDGCQKYSCGDYTVEVER